MTRLDSKYTKAFPAQPREPVEKAAKVSCAERFPIPPLSSPSIPSNHRSGLNEKESEKYSPLWCKGHIFRLIHVPIPQINLQVLLFKGRVTQISISTPAVKVVLIPSISSPLTSHGPCLISLINQTFASHSPFTMYPNKTLIYKSYSPYCPVPGVNLTVEPREFDPEADPPPGGITIRSSYLSLDPYQRGQMRSSTDTGTYSIPWVVGEPAVLTTLSTVLKSDTPSFKPGDRVLAMAAASEYATVPAEFVAMVRPLPPVPPGAKIPPPALISALGIPGLSAYVSFFEFICEPRAGKTILVSAASGGVGQVVGQLAKMHGMKVIGSTGSAEKVDFVVNELGFDAAWNYKEETTAAALARLAPGGLDFYYDNVGGEQLEVALTKIKDYGVIVSSGMISQYNKPDEEKYGIRTGMNIFFKRLSIYGFICSDPQHLAKYLPSFASDMLGWVSEGKLKTKEEVVVGLDNAPEAFARMMEGDKFGKVVLKIDEN
ncbi:hypothetical protein GGR54DRAFT_605123 [Hypoxylon sp. NC1633]|nr:hypothetical protein GGR54DRAFT_605123 [Hypoxylon sp. NC1633]